MKDIFDNTIDEHYFVLVGIGNDIKEGYISGPEHDGWIPITLLDSKRTVYRHPYQVLKNGR